MLNTPEMETQRLILRRFTAGDVEALSNIISHEPVNQFLPVFPFKTKAAAAQYLENQYLNTYQRPVGFRYAICLKPDNTPVGYVNVSEGDSYDLGYGLQQSHWHKGIVTEAAKAVVEQVRVSGIPYITATHDVNNPHSGGVMKKIGMTYRYSYEELWQPKNITVIFRMYQLNFQVQPDFVYRKYWDQYPVHFIEPGV